MREGILRPAPRPERSPRVVAGSLRPFAWTGCLAAVAVSAGAYGAGWLAPATDVDGWPLLDRLRSQQSTSTVASLVVLAGLLVLLGTWLLLGWRLRTSRADAAALGRLCAWWGVPFAVAPVLFSRDVFSYVAQSRLLPLGINPYLHGAGVVPGYVNQGADQLWRNAPVPYGPAWMGLSSLVYHATGGRAVPALLGFRFLAAVGVVLIAVSVPRLAAAAGANPATAMWLVLLNPLLLMHLVSAAHNDALMIGLLAAGMTAAVRGRLVSAAVLVALAGAVKAPALIGLPFVLFAVMGARGVGRSGSARAWAMATSQVAAVTAVVFAGLNAVTGLGFGWVANLGVADRVWMWLTPTTALGRFGNYTMSLLGVSDPLGRSIAVVRLIGMALTVAALVFLLLTGRRRNPVRGLGLALLAVAVFAPVLQPWYLLWGFVFLAAAGLSTPHVRAAVVATVGLAVYSAVNTSAMSAARFSLKDAQAAELSVGFALVLIALTVRRFGLPGPWNRPGPGGAPR